MRAGGFETWWTTWSASSVGCECLSSVTLSKARSRALSTNQGQVFGDGARVPHWPHETKPGLAGRAPPGAKDKDVAAGRLGNHPFVSVESGVPHRPGPRSKPGGSAPSGEIRSPGHPSGAEVPGEVPLRPEGLHSSINWAVVGYRGRAVSTKCRHGGRRVAISRKECKAGAEPVTVRIRRTGRAMQFPCWSHNCRCAGSCPAAVVNVACRRGACHVDRESALDKGGIRLGAVVTTPCGR